MQRSVTEDFLEAACRQPDVPRERFGLEDPLQGSKVGLGISLPGVVLLCRSVFKDPTYDNATHIEGVPDTYLPVRDGCRLTLYNDAHQVLLIPLHPLLSIPFIMAPQADFL